MSLSWKGRYSGVSLGILVLQGATQVGGEILDLLELTEGTGAV